MKATDYLKTEPTHALVYGDPGSFKSSIVIKLAEQGFKLKYFCIDGGVPLKILSAKGLENVEVFPIMDTVDNPIGIRTFRSVIRGGLCSICDAHGDVGCTSCRRSGLVFSDISLGNMAMNEIAVFDHLSGAADSAMAKVFDGEKALLSTNTSDNKQSYSDYRKQGWQMSDFLTRNQIAPFNTICITHQIMVDMEDNLKKLVPQMGTRDFSATAGKYFTDIIHCEANAQAKKFNFGSLSTYRYGVLTKSRNNVDMTKMDQPTLAPFFIDPSIGAETKPRAVIMDDAKPMIKAIDVVGNAVATGSGMTLAQKVAALKKGK